MPKQVFWPAALVIMGLIFLASNMGYLPNEFWHLWPIILIVAGLGGLLTADRQDWMVFPSNKRSSTSTKKSSPQKSSRKR